MIEFKKPLKISVENLDPVDIHYLLVSKDEPKDTDMTLIGLDVICQYDSTITSKNTIPTLTISDREIISNNSNDNGILNRIRNLLFT